MTKPAAGAHHSRQTLHLRTAAWYGDRQITVSTPASWNTRLFAPLVGKPLTDEAIRERLESPVSQQPIRELCADKQRPLVIVDDLNRPTPASRVIPHLLRHFEDAGIGRERVQILMAPGTHGRPPADAFAKKIGEEAASTCQTLVHDCNERLARIGRTSFGTPVIVPPEVVESDFIVGVGGVYPNHTGGFGGGSKLALGVLGFQSIATLHYRHQPEGWGSTDLSSTFRRDLDEISRMIGLNTTVSISIDQDRNVVDLTCGDHHRYLPALAEAQRAALRAQVPPSTARVVISNAYPMDLSLTFARMKGMLPLRYAAPTASRIAIAACPEGLGFHGLFPFLNAPRSHRRKVARVRIPIEVMRPRVLARKIAGRLSRKINSWYRHQGGAGASARYPIWLYCPDAETTRRLPAASSEFRITASWEEILEGVENEQGYVDQIEAVIYSCAALQCLA